MKILSAKQIQALDQATIINERISSLDLMEQAAKSLGEAIFLDFGAAKYVIFCGPGNNGGDGYALARLLQDKGAEVQIYEVRRSDQKLSTNADINKRRLLIHDNKHQVLDESSNLNFQFNKHTIVVDALFGNGLNRKLEGHFLKVISALNQLNNPKISIDVPSGLFADSNKKNNLRLPYKADYTYTLQVPKLSFFCKETAPFIGKLNVLNIGLGKEEYEKESTGFEYFNLESAQAIYTPRSVFSYKNSFGHALILAGAKNTIGSAYLSAKGCMQAGVGLLTVGLPKGAGAGLNFLLSEAMTMEDKSSKYLTQLPKINKYQAVAFGMGVGKSNETKQLLEQLLKITPPPLLIDADGLNILSQDQDLLKILPKNTILTPHVGEFNRLLNLAKLPNNYLDRGAKFAKTYKVIVVLKDAITTIFSPKGKIYFIKEGSVALATAGSGDVLSGVITALLANGYSPLEAACLGVFLHGSAGKKAGEILGEESTLAGDIPNFLGTAFKQLIN